MADAVQFDLSLMRGSDYSKQWSLTDQQTGTSLLNAGDTLQLVIKQAAGATPAYMTLSAAADTSTSGISGVNAQTGAFTVTIRGFDVGADIPGSIMDVIRCSWKFQVTSAGLTTVYAFGCCTVYPEA